MKLVGGRLVIETINEGMVAADAGDFAVGDGLTDMYRKLSPEQLPITMGRLASQDVLRVLQTVAETPGMQVAGYLDSAVAAGYLGLIELNGQ